LIILIILYYSKIVVKNINGNCHYREEIQMKSEFLNPDVMVVGSGIAGVGAALGAAKTGARVLLVTLEGAIGGDSLILHQPKHL